MNIIFLTLIDFNSFDEHNIYCDLLREFMKQGHNVYSISPVERRKGINTHFEENGRLLKLRIGNTQKTNIVEKGISTVLLESQFVAAIKKYFAQIKFDMVLYSTPPITLVGAIQFIKKRDNAKTYLMLKDIFPQNAVDLEMMTTTGLKGLLYKYFRLKEKKLYAVSDRIGCMSQKNVEYVLQHNPEVEKGRVEICPNCIEVQDMRLNASDRVQMRKKYGIPLEAKVFVYGGNLGKPQGIDFIIECLKSVEENNQAYFLIVGDGTEYGKLEAYFRETKSTNMQLMKRLPKDDYDRMIAACDVGMLFLDHRFTIPNFPSRLLSYMQAGLPVLACTDPNTDVGEVIVNGGFGWWCESDDVHPFCDVVSKICAYEAEKEKENSFEYLKKWFSAKRTSCLISKSVEEIDVCES